ncbi:glycosyltransferase family 4 protein [Lutibacter sp.]|uniref:glycosyltransferase family 4 protein n=1 Tax=Lutibacter sp. TaxID=1925666 RepID=UPI002733C5B0|nr:glycosyltransferase family 4 protein [Lutibacter sp.]MDP3312589.1 glycosyltransferase family 4 protein [Lutibacter sp.]
MNYKKSNQIIGLVLNATPGYSETFFISKIKGLQQTGHKVILFVNKREKHFNLCEVRKSFDIHKGNPTLFLINFIYAFFRLSCHPKNSLRFIKLEKKDNVSFFEIIKKMYLNTHLLTQNLDWIHFGFATLALGKEHVAKSINAKMGVSFRGYDINVYPLKHKDCYKLLWKNVDKVHSISQFLIDKAYTLGMDKDIVIEIITPAVNINDLPKLEVNSSSKINIVSISRLNWIKGLDIGIHAMKLLKDKNIDFEYHIIGDGNQIEIERYKFQSLQLELGNQLIFHGKLSHSQSLEVLKTATIYIQPSLNEGFCNAVLEAQAMGLLCVVSDGGALPENVINEETGWIFPRGNYKKLAELILKVNTLPKEVKEGFSLRAKKRIMDKFTIEQQIEQFVKFYN